MEDHEKLTIAEYQATAESFQEGYSVRPTGYRYVVGWE